MLDKYTCVSNVLGNVLVICFDKDGRNVNYVPSCHVSAISRTVVLHSWLITASENLNKYSFRATVKDSTNKNVFFFNIYVAECIFHKQRCSL